MSEPASELSTILLDQTDRLFQQHAGRAVLVAADAGEWPASLWEAVEAAELPLALVPEASGGAGLAFRDALNLVRRSAYHTAPIPLAEAIIANALWAAAGGPAVAGCATIAPTRPADALTLGSDGDGFVLQGTARQVPWGRRADHVLVFAHDARDDAWLALVPSALLLRQASERRNLAHEPRATIDFSGVRLAADSVRRAPAALPSDAVLLHGAAFRAAQITGAMMRCLDHALAYANERVQFGRRIGAFQAVQHLLASAAGQAAAAAAAVDAMAGAEGTPAFALAVAIAKARAGEAAGVVAAACHQVHGAMGFTQDHPLHFATRRLWAWREEFGAEPFWQERIGRLACAGGGEALWGVLTGD